MKDKPGRDEARAERAQVGRDATAELAARREELRTRLEAMADRGELDFADELHRALHEELDQVERDLYALRRGLRVGGGL
jgi:hypothetical protein